MRPGLKTLNLIVGILQLLVNGIFIIPATLNVFASGTGGYGYGILLLSVSIPLAWMTVFAFFGFFNYERYFGGMKTLLIAAYIIAVIVCILSFLWVPMVPFSLTGIPLFILLSIRIKEKNIGKRILLTNSIALVCQGILLLMAIR